MTNGPNLTAAEQAKLNRELERTKELTDQVTAARGEEVRVGKEADTIQAAITEGKREALTETQLQVEAMKDALALSEKQKDAIDTRREALLDLQSRSADMDDADKLALQQKLDLLKDQATSLEALGTQMEANLILAKEENRLDEQAGGLAGDILQKTLGISDAYKNTNTAKFFNQAKTEGFAGALSSVGKKMKGMLKPGAILGSTMMKVAEATVAMVQQTDSAVSSFKKATGAGAEMDAVIWKTVVDSREFSAGMAEAAAAVQTLYTDMSGFTDLSKEAQAQTATFTAGMSKLGVAGSDTAEIMDNAMKGWGMSVGEAQNVSKELLATATALKVPPGKMAKDFNMAMKELSKYGPKGVEVFKGLAATAKVAGVEVNELMAIAGKFDTIEGAASAAGELNAILGGNLLNSMQLLNATEDERIRILQKSVAASGRSWASMDRFEKQALMGAAGITDMNTANKLFGQSLGAYDAATKKAKAATAAQANMAEMTEAATSIAEKLQLVFERTAVVVMPLIFVVRFLANAMLGLMDVIYDIGETIQEFGENLPIIGWLFEGLGWVIKELAGPLGFIGLGFALLWILSLGGITTLTVGGMATSFMTAMSAVLGFVWSLVVGLGKALVFTIMGLASAAGSVWSLTASFLMCPITWIVVGIMALIAALYFLPEILDLVVDGFVWLWDTVVGFFTGTSKWVNWVLGIGTFFAPFITIPLLIYRNWEPIKNFFIVTLWGNLVKFGAWLKDVFVKTWHIIKDAIMLVPDAIVWMWDTFVGFFQEAGQWMDWVLGIGLFFAPFLAIPLLIMRYWEPISDFFSNMFGGILEGWKTILNAIISGLNLFVGGLNLLSFDVPSWVPGIGGMKFGFDIAEIPSLAVGGKITKGGVAKVHEGEEVVPAAEAEARSPMDDMLGFFKNPLGGMEDALGGLFGEEEEGADMTAILQALQDNTAAVNQLVSGGGKGGGEGGKTIVLQVNGRELGRAVTNSLNEINDLTLN